MGIASRQLRNPNPLGFPGGVLPGFDPSHVAATKAIFSSVALGANHLNLLKGLLGIPSGSPPPIATIDGRIGPSQTNGSGTSYSNFQFQYSSTTPDTAFTTAAIFTYTNISSGFGVIQYNLCNRTTLAVFPDFELNNIGGGNFATGFTPVAGRSYFLAISAIVGSIPVYVITDLTTGQIYSGLCGATNYSVGTNGGGTGFYVGDWTSGNAFIGNIAATSYSANALSKPQLLAWAQDPWTFWYPRRALNLVGVIAAGGFKPYWANSNLPVLGTGTY